jgi:hypothetical protein
VVEGLYARCIEARLLKETKMAAPILKPVSGQAELSVGDVVRSKEKYWLKTGQHLSGAIVRLERVPKSQIQAVGSDCWAYLNSGEGPISTDLLEMAPSVHSQLESLNAALENFQQKVKPEEPVTESRQVVTSVKGS